uniref:DNA binding protein n=1 Tax=Microviridae sp. ctMIi2 TaxID=2824993 RepID=A0A8S5R2E3_9VIRU|nr:MAG TPA: DNA binding protein [Microviridae sp. ctMIi2]
MTTNAYAVQDIKANRYNNPFFMLSHAEAMRAFQQNCQNPETLWHKYPEDFRLMNIGAFDDETANLTSFKTPIYLCSGLDYVKKTPVLVEPSVTENTLQNGLNDAGKHYIGKDK